MKKLVGLILGALSLAACQRAAAPTVFATPNIVFVTETPASPPTATAPVTPASPATPTLFAAPTVAPPVMLTFAASDGVTLAASFYPPPQSGAGQAAGVLLLHMLGRNRSDWDTFALELQKRGVAVLAMDLRGHGQSSGTADWEKAPADVRVGWDVLLNRPEVDASKCALVGASIGANLALIVGANNANVTTVIALSPGQDYQGVRPAGVLSNFGNRPVLFIASQDDSYAYASVQQMAPLTAAGETYYFSDAGHGTAMFSNPGLEPVLLDWLEKHLGVMKG